MMTVHEVSEISGLSVRTLHHYDKIGLFRPSSHSDAGYRLYDDASLERLLFIMLYRNLDFPLEEIKSILDSRHYDRNAALRQQIEMLTAKKEHLENMITLAQGLLFLGTNLVNSGTVVPMTEENADPDNLITHEGEATRKVAPFSFFRFLKYMFNVIKLLVQSKIAQKQAS